MLSGNDRTLTAANFQFVPVRVLEKERVIPRTVIETDFGTFQIFSTGLPHQFRNLIDFLCRIGPERDACSVRLMILVLGESEELRRFVGASRIKSVEISARFLTR